MLFKYPEVKSLSILFITTSLISNRPVTPGLGIR